MLQDLFGLGSLPNLLTVLAGLVTARLAIRTARTPQGAVAWVVGLLAFPLLAIPLYALVGGVAGLRGSADAPELEVEPATLRAAAAASGPDRLRAVTVEPFEGGNHARLLVDGRATFDAIHDAIDRAETEVLVQFYILAADIVGHALGERLKAAARRGVRVHLLCDLVGSLLLPRGYVRDLRAAGVEVHGFRGPGPRWLVRPNFRNHRKAVVVDGRVGFTGGLNARRDHLDGGTRFAAWRDTFVRIEGPAAAQLRTVFAEDWDGIAPDPLPPLPAPPPAAGTMRACIVATGRADGLERGPILLCGLIGMARRRLWIASPYFVPDIDVLTALQLAALRGVDLRVLVPRPPDKWVPWLAARAYFDDVQAAGGQVLEYEPGFAHQKVMLVDDDLASIGTMNIDIRSAALNFEQTALVHDRGFAREVEAMLLRDFARCRDAALHPPGALVRFFAPVARLFAPLL